MRGRGLQPRRTRCAVGARTDRSGRRADKEPAIRRTVRAAARNRPARDQCLVRCHRACGRAGWRVAPLDDQALHGDGDLMAKAEPLGERLTKAIRIRGDGARRTYHAARRAARFLRDGPRRAALRRLPPTALEIPPHDGFLVQPPGVFDEVPAIVADAHAALARFDAAATTRGGSQKRFLVNVLDAATLTPDSAVVRLALRDDVVASVSRYLGTVPCLSTITVFFSDTVEGTPKSSQLHHCDGDDVTQVKIFIYCTDVDIASGPLTVLGADDSARVRKASRYQYRQRLTDDQVAAVLGPEAEHPILGPAGTLAFVDTSRCFHYGSRVAPGAAPRLVTMIQYQTPYSFMSTGRAEAPFARFDRPTLPPLQHLVLSD